MMLLECAYVCLCVAAYNLVFVLLFSLQNTEHFAMLGLGDIVSNIMSCYKWNRWLMRLNLPVGR